MNFYLKYFLGILCNIRTKVGALFPYPPLYGAMCSELDSKSNNTKLGAIKFMFEARLVSSSNFANVIYYI